MASSVAAFSDMDPQPRVRFQLDPADLAAETVAVTVWRLSKWGQVLVRNAIKRPVLGGFVEYDYELPPGVPVTYRVEQFDFAGASLGFVLALPAEVTVPVGWAVLSDPLAPGNAVLIPAERRFAGELRRSRLTALYQAGDRTVAMSGTLSLLQDVALRCVTQSEAERDSLGVILAETIVLVRTMPQMRLPGALYAVLSDVPMIPVNAVVGGEVDVWDLVGQEVSRPLLDVLVAVFSYDLYKAYVATLGGTYAAAKAHWSTYLDAMANPPEA